MTLSQKFLRPKTISESMNLKKSYRKYESGETLGDLTITVL